MEHLLLIPNENPYECTECGRRCRNEETFKEHLSIHSNNKNYHCTECGKQFQRKSYLIQHMVIHSDEKQYQCTKCNKQFIRKSNLLQHMLIHKEKKYSCTECGKQFRVRNRLMHHLVLHSDEKQYHCTECGKTFRSNANLRYHVITTHSEKRHQCTVCGKQYGLKDALTKHLLTHTKEKKYSCAECKKQFGLKDSFKKHLLIHSGGKRFNCTQCGRKFGWKTSLARHMLHHSDNNLYECSKNEEHFDEKTIAYECDYLQCESSQSHILEKEMTSNSIDRKNNEIDDSIPSQEIMQVLEIKMENEERPDVENEVIVPDCFESYNDGHCIVYNRKNSERSNSVSNPLESNRVECDINKQRVNKRETAVKSQFAKFAKIWNQSYNSCNDTSNKLRKDFCQLDERKRLSVENPYHNFWKFKCQREYKREPPNVIKRAENVAKDTFTWKLESDDSFGNNYKPESTYPSFIQHVIKVFDKFFNETQIQDEFLPHEKKKKEQNEEYIKMLIQANSKGEVIIILTAHNDNSNTKYLLQKYLQKIHHSSWNVKSLYYRSIHSKCDWSNCKTSLLYGMEELDETICEIRFKLFSKLKFSLHPTDTEILVKTVNDYLTPCLNITLLHIGCRNGVMSLILSSKYKEIIGVDSSSEVKIAQKICRYNHVKNVIFEKAEMRNVELLFEKIKNRNEVVAIVNNNVDCGQSTVMMKNLRQLTSLNRLVIITRFTEECFPSILQLMQPSDNYLGSRFIPLRACIVDTTSREYHFEIVILMEREKPQVISRLKEEFVEESNVKLNDSTYSSSSDENEICESKEDILLGS